MMKLMKFILIASIIIALGGCSASKKNNAANENSIFWKVSKKGILGDSYLYGTFHMLCQDDIVFSNTMKQAVEKADEVYFEIDLDDNTASVKLMGALKMKNGETMLSIFSTEEYARVEKFFKDSLSIGIASMKQYKPFFLVSLMYPKLLPCKTKSSVDQEILILAKKYKKTISGLETVEFQASVFDSIPYRIQAKELLKTIDSINIYRGYFAQMVNAYKFQKINELMKVSELETLSSPEFNAVMLDNRNKKWVDELKEILPAKRIFMAVGAGHLPGKNGLIALLKAQGYTVTPVK